MAQAKDMTRPASRAAEVDDDWRSIPFTVDAALLRELGELLVGKPYIALAELVKNAYDADARHCELRFGEDRIEVTDDGQGMTFAEFEKFWMRVGTIHKQQNDVSRHLNRPVTGSKGVGRLAVQFLADRLHMTTTAESTPKKMLLARVNWNEAIMAGDLTEAEAQYREKDRDGTYANGSIHGTRIVLTNLSWSCEKQELADLARELWMLQPPVPQLWQSDEAAEDQDHFQIVPGLE